MAFDMANDQLSSQFATVDELRARVGIVLSGAAVATGFLAGQALNTSRGVPLPAWFGIVAAFGLIVCSAVILWPREWQGLTQNAQAVLDDVTSAPDRDMASYYTVVAGYAITASKKNKCQLDRLYRLFSVSLGLLVVDFAGWIWTLAINN